MTVVPKDTTGKRKVYKRGEEIDVLLEENSRHYRKFDHLKERLNIKKFIKILKRED